MESSTTDGHPEGELRRRARLRRLDRLKARSATAARRACLTCPMLALLWILGLYYDLPAWSVALITLGGLLAVALGARLALRGRTVREPL